MTGLNRKALDALLPTFNAVYEQTLLEQPRQRALGGGRKARLRTPRTNCSTFCCTSKFNYPGLKPLPKAKLKARVALPTEAKICSNDAQR